MQSEDGLTERSLQEERNIGANHPLNEASHQSLTMDLEVKDEEEDNLIQTCFLESQSALLSATNSESTKQLLRLELETFLDDCSKKVDSEGKALIQVPSNFDVVADAMNRNDLTSTEERPWSKYLLADQVEKDLERNDFEGGRYRNVFKVDNGLTSDNLRLQRELAEIHLLDNQLMKISKKAALMKTLPVEDQREWDTHESYTCHDVNQDRTPRSVISRLDVTFMTRGRGSEVASAATSDRADTPSTVPMDNLSPGEAERVGAGIARFGGDDTDETDFINALDVALATHEVKDMKIPGKKKKKRNFLEENAEKVYSHSRLSKAEEERLNILLQDGYEGDEKNDSYFIHAILGDAARYGYTKEEEDAVKSIDEELKKYGRLNRLEDDDKTCMSGNQHGKSDKQFKENDLHGKLAKSYLSELKEARKEKTHLRQIDELLDKVKSTNEVDLLALADMKVVFPKAMATSNTDFAYCDDSDGEDPVSSSSDDHEDMLKKRYEYYFSNKKNGPLQVPAFKDVKCDRKITRENIMELISCAMLEEDKDNLEMSGTNRQKLDRLLNDMRCLVDQLSDLRNSDHTDGNSLVKGNHKSQDTFLEDIDDIENIDLSIPSASHPNSANLDAEAKNSSDLSANVDIQVDSTQNVNNMNFRLSAPASGDRLVKLPVILNQAQTTSNSGPKRRILLEDEGPSSGSINLPQLALMKEDSLQFNYEKISSVTQNSTHSQPILRQNSGGTGKIYV